MWESEKIPFSPYRRGVSNIKRILEKKTVGSKTFTGFGLLEIPPGGGCFLSTPIQSAKRFTGSGTIMVEEVPAKVCLTFYVSGEFPHGIRNQTDKPLTVSFVRARL